MPKPKLDTTPQEWCHACETFVWSRASHMFVCPAVNTDLDPEFEKAWKAVETQLQEYARRQL